MSVYSKIIHVLDQKNSSLKKELASEEAQIGFLYLEDAACSEEETDRFLKLKAELQQLLETLAEVNSLETKKASLSADIQNVKAELAGLVSKESSLMLTLGIALYGQPGAASVPSFSKAYEEASSYADKITSMKTQSEQMTESLELQNVFSRVVTKVKINSLSLSINSQQKKLDSILIAGAKAVVDAQDLTDELKCPAYETCVAFKNDWNKARISLEALQDELQNVEVTLGDYGRKPLLQEKADAKNAEVEEFAFQTGHAFDKKYITRDGDVLAEFPPRYAEGLSRVLAIRTDLASVNRRLDILQYSEQIDAARHAHESMKKEVASNEEKISRLNAENEELARRMDENVSVSEELSAHRAAVEKEEGISAEELLAAGEAAPESVVMTLKRETEHIMKKAGKAAVKAAGTVKKAASKKTASKKEVPEEKADEQHIGADEDAEEAEFMDALNAAKASASAGKEEA